MANRPKRDLIKVHLNLPIQIIELIDEYANKTGISRTTVITILIAERLGVMSKDKE